MQYIPVINLGHLVIIALGGLSWLVLWAAFRRLDERVGKIESRLMPKDEPARAELR